MRTRGKDKGEERVREEKEAMIGIGEVCSNYPQEILIFPAI